MSMTKKDYELVAQAILGECFTEFDTNSDDFTLVDGVDYQTVTDICNALADTFEKDNKDFKRDRFLEACGINN